MTVSSIPMEICPTGDGRSHQQQRKKHPGCTARGSRTASRNVFRPLRRRASFPAHLDRGRLRAISLYQAHEKFFSVAFTSARRRCAPLRFAVARSRSTNSSSRTCSGNSRPCVPPWTAAARCLSPSTPKESPFPAFSCPRACPARRPRAAFLRQSTPTPVATRLRIRANMRGNITVFSVPSSTQG